MAKMMRTSAWVSMLVLLLAASAQAAVVTEYRPVELTYSTTPLTPLTGSVSVADDYGAGTYIVVGAMASAGTPGVSAVSFGSIPLTSHIGEVGANGGMYVGLWYAPVSSLSAGDYDVSISQTWSNPSCGDAVVWIVNGVSGVRDVAWGAYDSSITSGSAIGFNGVSGGMTEAGISTDTSMAAVKAGDYVLAMGGDRMWGMARFTSPIGMTSIEQNIAAPSGNNGNYSTAAGLATADAQPIGFGYNSAGGFYRCGLAAMAFTVGSLPAVGGDANGDGVVNDADLSLLLSNWAGTGKAWANGDFNDDTNVNDSDLSILLANWGFGVTVPEPALMSLLGVGLPLLRRRR